MDADTLYRLKLDIARDAMWERIITESEKDQRQHSGVSIHFSDTDTRCEFHRLQ